MSRCLATHPGISWGATVTSFLTLTHPVRKRLKRSVDCIRHPSLPATLPGTPTALLHCWRRWWRKRGGGRKLLASTRVENTLFSFSIPFQELYLTLISIRNDLHYWAIGPGKKIKKFSSESPWTHQDSWFWCHCHFNYRARSRFRMVHARLACLCLV